MGEELVPGVSVSRETMSHLDRLATMTKAWTRKINLVAPSTVDVVWDRHIRDSAQLLALTPVNWRHWVDLGSGGGFPGLVIAILARADREITLIESDLRKCTFLRTVIRELGLAAKVVNDRIENARIAQADIVSARALAPLGQLLNYTSGILDDSGTALFPKGQAHTTEILTARETWCFECDALPSITNPDARILRISRIRKRGSQP
jgi:16S rRNA (guanine527-N7)-methyltransferase